MKLIIIFLFVFICFRSFATSYYLSGEGNDSNTGLNKSAPWQTLNRLNQVLFQPGDSVFFQCGSKFYGQINLKFSGNSEKRICFNSYGSGLKPIISGSFKINEWEKYADNIWRCQIGKSKARQLFEGKNRLPVCRYPNSGFLYADLKGTKNSFKDDDLKSSAGIYNEAILVIRNSDFHWENKIISSSDEQGNVVLSSAVNNTIDGGQGYFLTNKPEFVDQQDEWYHDDASGYLYLYSKDHPAGRNFFASLYDYGIKGEWNINNISIDNLCFAEQSMDGIWLRGAGCYNNSVTNCFFIGQRNFGLSLMGNNLYVVNNHFENIGGLGFDGYGIDQIKIESNNFKNIGTTPGVSMGGVGDMQAIRLWNTKNAIVSLNSIDSTGYSGLTFNVDSGIIEKNSVTHSLLATSDGGAYYCYGKDTKHLTIQNNISESVFGNLAGRPFVNQTIRYGIYLDNYVTNCSVKYNTSVGAGLTTNAGTASNSFIGNTVYKSSTGITISDWFAGASVSSINLEGNVFFTNVVMGTPVLIQSDDNNFNVFGSSDHNRFYNPYEDKVVSYEWSQTNTFTLSEWVSQTGLDLNTLQCPFRWNYGVDPSFILINRLREQRTYRFENPVQDIDNKVLTTITLEPFSSKILIGKNAIVTRAEDLSYAEKLISIFPNPALSILNIRSKYPIKELKIVNSKGSLVYRSSQFNSKILDVSTLISGLYLLVAEINGIRITERIIIQ